MLAHASYSYSYTVYSISTLYTDMFLSVVRCAALSRVQGAMASTVALPDDQVIEAIADQNFNRRLAAFEAYRCFAAEGGRSSTYSTSSFSYSVRAETTSSRLFEGEA